MEDWKFKVIEDWSDYDLCWMYNNKEERKELSKESYAIVSDKSKSTIKFKFKMTNIKEEELKDKLYKIVLQLTLLYT